jgi:hypothetical protein
MPRHTERPETGIEIGTLDLTPVFTQLLETWDWGEKGKPSKLSTHGSWGFVEANGKAYVLGTEGVGYDLDEEPIRLGIYTEYGEKEGASISMFPAVEVEFTDEDIEELRGLVSGTEPLETFIRTFGRRLETNFSLWHKELSGYSVASTYE